jgi:hypothetical protein
MGFLRQSEQRSFTVADGEEAKFECHTGWNFYAQLRPAITRDIQQMEEALASPLVPRNLGEGA